MKKSLILMNIKMIGVYRFFFYGVLGYISGFSYKRVLKALHVILAGLNPFSNQAFLLQVRISYAF